MRFSTAVKNDFCSVETIILHPKREARVDNMVTMVVWISGGKERKKKLKLTSLRVCVVDVICVIDVTKRGCRIIIFSSLSSAGPVDSVGRTFLSDLVVWSARIQTG